MQTSSRLLLNPFPFLAKFRRRQQLLAEDVESSGIEIRHSITFPLGKKWQATMDGKWIGCILFSIVLYLLAALLANEWLYLLSCALMAAALLGAVFPVIILASIAVDSWLPDKGIAADDAQISVMIRHKKWLGPAKHLVPLGALRSRIILARRSAGGYRPNKDLGEQSILIESVGDNTLLTLAVPHLQRGIYKLSHLSICTSFPFGLIWWQRKITPTRVENHTDAIVVFPRVLSMRGNFLLQIKGMLSSMGMAFSEKLALTHSTSVRGLREFRQGDSLRHIHWPSSARSAKLLVREFDSETLPIFDLYLDLTAAWKSAEQFELAVCLAHSLIQFGYERDMLPELFLRPAIDAPELDALMHDLPSAKPPLEMLSEILARVEPIILNAPSPSLSTKRQLLTLAPATETVLRSSKDQGLYGVNLIAIEGDDGETTRKFAGDVVATIYSEDDLEAL